MAGRIGFSFGNSVQFLFGRASYRKTGSHFSGSTLMGGADTDQLRRNQAGKCGRDNCRTGRPSNVLIAAGGTVISKPRERQKPEGTQHGQEAGDV
jgi:hypothetical protein